MGHGLQRAVQVASCAVTAAQVYLHQQRTQAMAAAERDERARRALAAQIRADREAARAGWAPALDPDWLRQADLFQAARTWGAAMPYADRSMPWYEPAAATALRKSEERLRDLHPYAMAYYDRLRADGLGPAEAMYQAAPLFTRHPHTHDAPSTPRPGLHAGTGTQAPGPHPPTRPADPVHRQPRTAWSSVAGRSRKHCKRRHAHRAATRCGQTSCERCWRPSQTCRPMSSTGSPDRVRATGWPAPSKTGRRPRNACVQPIWTPRATCQPPPTWTSE